MGHHWSMMKNQLLWIHSCSFGDVTANSSGLIALFGMFVNAGLIKVLHKGIKAVSLSKYGKEKGKWMSITKNNELMEYGDETMLKMIPNR